ncbi:glycosyltransferase family 32 protein [Rhizoctonia solani]|uniref:Glycosyltransferase family 32 protein n=1 Tax=Rhizoctonia solani TaxID=456999 RepID=A0A8H8PAE8_9AGAM|nr:glycosyltransferase family 32 protein [Rhizoctonia solani]QRW27723.1 glycosyltransferase family 32 protein [Rhizoctonia solani]
MHTFSYRRPRNLVCLAFAGFTVLLTSAVLFAEYSSIETKHTLCATILPDTSVSRTTYTFNETAPRARAINPRTLISTVAAGQRVSARFIHQSWKTHDLKPSTVPLADSWRLSYPGWEYVLWDDADNKELVRVLYPRLLATYEALPREIYRADFVRNLYMHAFGGIYADLDSEAVAPLEPLLSASSERLAESPSTPVAFVGEMVTAVTLPTRFPMHSSLQQPLATPSGPFQSTLPLPGLPTGRLKKRKTKNLLIQHCDTRCLCTLIPPTGPTRTLPYCTLEQLCPTSPAFRIATPGCSQRYCASYRTTSSRYYIPLFLGYPSPSTRKRCDQMRLLDELEDIRSRKVQVSRWS